MNRIQLCFGKVHHARVRPTRNSFNYGVYFLRLPIRTLGTLGALGNLGTLESSSPTHTLFSRNRFNLLSFHDKDHGGVKEGKDGKEEQRPLLDWIEEILKQANINDADGEIWLQAFPRVLGYVFNPVSFWFCHRQDGALRAVVCEVNNTFGERHCYLLDQGVPIVESDMLTARKVFHVSPFCKVEGAYQFQFKRSANDLHTLARINYHDAHGPLLLTSIKGTSQPLTDRGIAHALLRFPFMTFGVIAKIHWQALKLWIKHVPYFTKPAPPLKELSR